MTLFLKFLTVFVIKDHSLKRFLFLGDFSVLSCVESFKTFTMRVYFFIKTFF